MSDHDPFDGIYDKPATPQQAAERAESSDQDLRRLHKAALIELAEARGLDTTGTKDELVERIEAAQA